MKTLFMELTKDEKRLLSEIEDAWEIEGCFTTRPGCWVRDDRKDTGSPTKEDKEEGNRRFIEAMNGINLKLGFNLFSII